MSGRSHCLPDIDGYAYFEIKVHLCKYAVNRIFLLHGSMENNNKKIRQYIYIEMFLYFFTFDRTSRDVKPPVIGVSDRPQKKAGSFKVFI